SGAHVHLFLFCGEQVDQERGQAVLAERVGHVPIAWAMPATAAPVGEKDKALGGRRNVEVAFNDDRPGVNADQKLGGVLRDDACHDRNLVAERAIAGAPAATSRCHTGLGTLITAYIIKRATPMPARWYLSLLG